MSSPRLDYLDFDLINRIVVTYEQNREKFITNEKEETHKFPQRAYAGAHFICEDLAYFKYALGFPLPIVRELLGEALKWLERTFELRGTEFGLLVTNIDSSGSRTQKPRKPAFDLTNSAQGLDGIYLALIVGGVKRAAHIAEMVWDPPDADYIGTDSDVCTPDQQHLAYAVKNLILPMNQFVHAELDLISSGCTPDIRFQATILRAILNKKSGVFLSTLDDLLNWHRKEALRKQNRYSPDFFVCRPALGLCLIAAQRNCISINMLPSDVYLPLALVGQ